MPRWRFNRTGGNAASLRAWRSRRQPIKLSVERPLSLFGYLR